MLPFGVSLIKYEDNRQLFEEKIAQGVIFYHQLLSWKSPVPALLAQSSKTRSSPHSNP